MSYNKTTWANGDVITAEKLNNIESGVEEANSPLVVNFTWDSEEQVGRTDKTFGEIRTALENGRLVGIKNMTDDSNGLSVSFYIIHGITYNVSEGEFANGTVEAASQNIAATAYITVDTPPYTLEALDAKYPYF